MSWASRLAKLAVQAIEERAAPLAVKGGEKRAASLAVKKAEQAAPRALPAPPKRLALPAPGPGLPPLAAKPRGGQWWPNKNIGSTTASEARIAVKKAEEGDKPFEVWKQGRVHGRYATEDEARAAAERQLGQYNPNHSPENAARAAWISEYGQLTPGPDDIHGPLHDWWMRAAPRYFKNDLGTPDDPMRALAEQGLLHAQMTPEEWASRVDHAMVEDTIGQVLYPRNPLGGMPGAGDELRASAMVNAPWLAKAPVTDKVYGLRGGQMADEGLEFGHLLDEMRNAMDPQSGIPADLAVRPEMLQRMSLPQAAERVGRINQFRAKQMEQAALSNLNSPVVQTFKEYPENNPMGLRWVELNTPKLGDDLGGYQIVEEPNVYPHNKPGYVVLDQSGREVWVSRTRDDALSRVSRDQHKDALANALRYEGDTMGHCVGGYCDDVLSGRSRIFSLRDAKGEPHVTIETAPGQLDDLRSRVPMDVQQQIADQFGGLNTGPNFNRAMVEWAEKNLTVPENIVQIKGKQNRAPNDEYRPFVQDFVKSGTWGDVGDLRNTGLVKLPDGRYIRQDQWNEGMSNALRAWNPKADDAALQEMLNGHGPNVSSTFSDADWEATLPYFEGYAIGGRVSADRCFTRHPFAAGRR